MKKVIIMLCCLCLLAGCSKKSNETVSLESYDQYMEELNNNEEFKVSSELFNTTLILNRLEDQTVRYDLIINHPTKRLSNIKVLCKEANSESQNNPSIGIIETEEYILDPEIKDEQQNIYKGINLSGISQNEKVTLNILIEYTIDEGNLKREFIQITKELEE